MIRCSRWNPPRVAIALAFAQDPRLFLGELQCLSSLYSEGRVLVPLTYNYGGDTCPFAPLVLPAWCDSIWGGEGGFQYSGTDEFRVTPIFNSMSNPSRTFMPGNALWYPPGITAPVEFPRKRAFAGGTTGHRLVANWVALLRCQRWCVSQDCFTVHQNTSFAVVLLWEGDLTPQLCFLLHKSVYFCLLLSSLSRSGGTLFTSKAHQLPNQSLVHFLKKRVQASDVVLLLALFLHPSLSWSVWFTLVYEFLY